MRRLCFFAAALFLTAGLWGCAGSADIGKPLPASLVTVKPAPGYARKIAVALVQIPPTAHGKKIGDLFFDSLTRSLRRAGPGLRLVMPADEMFPAFVEQLVRDPGAPVDASDLARQGRLTGYNGVLLAAVRGLRSYSKKTGNLWFRKTSYFISYDLTIDLYDPLTATKIVAAVEEASVEVSHDDYQAVQDKGAAKVEELEEKLVAYGEQIGAAAAALLEDSIWMIPVVMVEGQRVHLPAGRLAGLAPGARLVVFEGRRLIQGQGKERFIVPGPRVGTVQVSTVEPESSTAVVLEGGTIQAGDIAAAVKE